MAKFFVARSKLTTVGVVAGLILATATLLRVSAQTPQGPAQSDHALFLAPERVYCGVAMIGKQAEPYTLHVSATNPGASPATLTITFGDRDSIGFEVPAHSSFSTTQALGGVPGVDDVVKITIPGGAAMASVQVRAGAKDPFAGDGELDNFCLTKPGDPGTPPPF